MRRRGGRSQVRRPSGASEPGASGHSTAMSGEDERRFLSTRLLRWVRSSSNSRQTQFRRSWTFPLVAEINRFSQRRPGLEPFLLPASSLLARQSRLAS